MSVWGGRGRKNGIYRNLLESINDTPPRIPLVTVMPRVCRDCRHVRLREWNEMWGDIKCAVLNFFSHADNRRTKSLSAANSWKNPHRSFSLDQNGFNSDFYHKTFQVVWGTKKSCFHFYRFFFLIDWLRERFAPRPRSRALWMSSSEAETALEAERVQYWI